MIKILGICGSPRRHGNTETLLDAALNGAKLEGAITEKIIVSELRINPCHACYRCAKTGICIVKDDMHAIYKKLAGADGVIIASPVYFGSITAQLKIMVDRFQAKWVKMRSSKKPIAGKRNQQGVFLCVAGEGKIKFFRNARSIIRYLFATLGIKYSGGIFASSVSGVGDINKKPMALKKAFVMGAKLARSVTR